MAERQLQRGQGGRHITPVHLEILISTAGLDDWTVVQHRRVLQIYDRREMVVHEGGFGPEKLSHFNHRLGFGAPSPTELQRIISGRNDKLIARRSRD